MISSHIILAFIISSLKIGHSLLKQANLHDHVLYLCRKTYLRQASSICGQSLWQVILPPDFCPLYHIMGITCLELEKNLVVTESIPLRSLALQTITKAHHHEFTDHLIG